MSIKAYKLCNLVDKHTLISVNVAATLNNIEMFILAAYIERITAYIEEIIYQVILKKEETKQGRAEGLDNIQITFSHLFSDFNHTQVNNQILTKHRIHQDNSKTNGQ